MKEKRGNQKGVIHVEDERGRKFYEQKDNDVGVK